MLYTDKYAPKKVEDYIGNREKLEHIKQWILQYLTGKKRKPLLLWGPPGVGKTSIAYVLKNQFDLDLVEMNASELRNKKRVERILGGSALAESLFGRGKIILIDDADILAGRKDSGGSSAIRNFLRDSKHPVIVTAGDIWDKKFTPIRSECEPIELKRINKISLKNYLLTIVKSENLNISPEKIEEIADGAEGDVRAALNDLQSMRSSSRNKEMDIFKAVRGIFKARTYNEAKEAISGDIDYEILKLWIDENIPLEYDDPNDLSAAYDSLSKADMFDGRIRRTHWKLLKYSIDLSTAGVALAKEKVYHKFTKYAFPGYLRNMARTVQKRAMLKSIGKKLGVKLHVSSKLARDYLPIFKELGKKYPQDMMDFYSLEEDELAFILETSVSKIKK
ncbi:MAG: replication factor C large subunit [Candidatus Micrarchaeota archaeon]|nr:replication factor C large subunit [Candidatus Micrarchaeota archaeon]